MKKLLFPLMFVLVLGLAACEDEGPVEEELDGNVPATESYVAWDATFNVL